MKNGKRLLGVKSGTVGGRFEKGHVPWNAGRPMDEWASPEQIERFMEHSFKEGELTGRDARKPIGSETVDADGYVWVKVAWRKKEIPPRCMVVFADHDKGNFDPDNLVLMTMAEHQVVARKGIGYSSTPELMLAIASARLLMKATGMERDDGVERATLPMEGRTTWRE